MLYEVITDCSWSQRLFSNRWYEGRILWNQCIRRLFLGVQLPFFLQGLCLHHRVKDWLAWMLQAIDVSLFLFLRILVWKILGNSWSECTLLFLRQLKNHHFRITSYNVCYTKLLRNPVKAVAMIKDVAMLNINGAAMVGAPGSYAKVFDVLGKNNINVMMVSTAVRNNFV